MTSVYFITQGCSANYSDTEIMKGILYKRGYDITEYEDSADIIVFNTCTVKGPTESFFWRKLKELNKKRKKVIIAGCIPQAERDLKKLAGYSLIGINQIDKIDYIVEETIKGNIIVNLAKDKLDKSLLPRIRKNKIIEVVQISTGCTDSCSYCKTKFARGDIQSFRIRSIREQIVSALKEGVKEIWLTSQDNGAYGKDLGSNLIELLKDIAKIGGDFKVRIGMANPHHLLNFLDELIWVIKENKKFFQFLHIPIQSGSNKVLKDMKRNYTIEDYIFIYKRLKEELPFISLSNDIIIGYPTETEKDFKETVELIKRYPTDVMNISRFWPRHGTLAYKLKQLPGSKVKERSRIVTKLYHELAKKDNEKWKNWEGIVLFDEKGKDNSFVGRNFAYKPVIVHSNIGLIGKKFKVRVEDTTIHDLRAKILEEV